MAEAITKIYRRLSQAPTIVSARIIDKYYATVRFSQANFDAQKNVRFQIGYMYGNDSWAFSKKSLPVDVTNEKYVSYSQSGKYFAIIREQKSKKENHKQFLEIWSGDGLVNSVDLRSLDLHGDIYTDDTFGSMQWSKQEHKLAYIAEKKVPKSEPFYKRKPYKNEESEILKGDEYAFKQDWGEQTTGKKESVIAIYDIYADTVSIIEGIDDTLFPAQIIWGPNDSSLIGVAYHTFPRKFGIVYCSNRKSEIFKVDFDGNYKCISKEGNAVKSPRFTPDFKYLVWLERKMDGPHHACMKLMRITYSNLEKNDYEIEEVIGIVNDSIRTRNGSEFFGMYNFGLLERCWLPGGRKLIFSTIKQCCIVTYFVDIETKDINELLFNDDDCVKKMMKSNTILDCYENMIIIKRQSLTYQDSAIIGYLNDTNLEWLHLSDDTIILPGLENYKSDIVELECPNKSDSINHFSVNYIYPENSNLKSFPLILWPHGGPHGASLNIFRISMGVFAHLNMAMVLVNYRGSTGAGQKSTEYILEHVNRSDIEDCMTALNYCLKTDKRINPKSIFLYGGSYGGFLVSHLSGQFPDMFKAVVAINPVIDIASMALTSDIPDWSFVESGSQFSQKNVVDDKLLLKMRHLSPIQNLDKIKAPTLILLGTKDLRVPHFQGLYYYYCLKANGIETKVYLYEDNHNLTAFKNEMDSVINSALWFLKYSHK